MKSLFFAVFFVVFVSSIMALANAQNTTLSENNTSNDSQSNLNTTNVGNTTNSSVSKSQTSTTITPNPFAISQGNVVHYTVTVTDASNTPTSPTGTVSWFARTSVGEFQPNSCILVPSSTNSKESSCEVSYTAPNYCSCSVPVTIVASYLGDTLHQVSSASAYLNSIGLTMANVKVVPNETQVTAGSPVQLTVTVTNSSGSVVPGPSTVLLKPVEANALEFVHPPSIIVTNYVNIAGIQVPADCYAPAADAPSPGTFCGAFDRGTVTPSSCTLSSSGCVFTYVPPVDYHGPVLLIGRFTGTSLYDESYGNVTLQVNPSGVSLPPTPSYANTIIAQNGNITVRFVNSFGSPGYSDGQMATPQGIALDQSGNIYVAELNSKRVDKFDSSGHLLSKIGEGILTSPTNVAVDKAGNVYVVDISSETVYKFDSAENLLSKFQPFGKCDLGDSSIHNMEPQGIVIDNSGNVYVTDLCDIQKYDSNGNMLSKFGSYGSGDGQFTGTGDIAVDKSGYVYVADSTQRIEKFDPNGKYILQFGTRGHLNGQFDAVEGIAIDKFGNIWVTDSDNYRVQVFDHSGNFMFTFGVDGSGPGQFNDPNDIVIDSSDNMYATDQNNNRVQVFHIEYGTTSNPTIVIQSAKSSQETDSPSTTSSQPALDQKISQLNAVPPLSSISKAPSWVKAIFSFHDQGEISDTDLINAVNFLMQQNIIKLG